MTSYLNYMFVVYVGHCVQDNNLQQMFDNWLPSYDSQNQVAEIIKIRGT